MRKIYSNVWIKKIEWIVPGFTQGVPGEKILTEQLEERVMQAIKNLPFPKKGFLDFYTGVKTRYLWIANTNLAEECGKIIRKCIDGLPVENILSYRYGSVTRTVLEPAMAALCLVGTQVSREAVVYDTSNACCGLATAMKTVADEIYTGQTQYGVVYGIEDARPVLDSTLDKIEAEYKESDDREFLNENIPTLTFGSGACSILMGNDGGMCKVKGVVSLSDPSASLYCLGGKVDGGLAVRTQAQLLREHGNEIVEAAVNAAMDFFGLSYVDAIITHQVGKFHQSDVERKLSRIARDVKNFTYDIFGNVGACSAPITFAKAYEEKKIGPGDDVLLVCFGSGLSTYVYRLEMV